MFPVHLENLGANEFTAVSDRTVADAESAKIEISYNQSSKISLPLKDKSIIDLK